MFDLIFFGILSILGLIFLIWSIFTDLRQFRVKKNILSLIPFGLGIVLTTIIWIWNIQIQSNFDKPTLLRIYHDGDFNGTSIDFKTDGTYIFNNSAIGLSNFQYGEYQINGNQITLDRSKLDFIKTNRLAIQPKVIKYLDRTENDKYVYQVDKYGKVLKNSTEFRLVVDNRK